MTMEEPSLQIQRFTSGQVANTAIDFFVNFLWKREITLCVLTMNYQILHMLSGNEYWGKVLNGIKKITDEFSVSAFQRHRLRTRAVFRTENVNSLLLFTQDEAVVAIAVVIH
jgi:hypothetical protein